MVDFFFTSPRSLTAPKATLLPVFAVFAAIALAGCQTDNTSDAVIRIDRLRVPKRTSPR